MEEWGKDQEAGNVLLLPDGNGAFTEAMGMLVDKSDLNFGKRSWRYSMLVRDEVIEKMFIEPQKPGDPFEVSDADTMLHYLDPEAKAPDQVAILTREGCPFCARAKKLLDEAGIDYVEVPLPHTIRSKAARRDRAGPDGAAGVRQRRADRRHRCARGVGEEAPARAAAAPRGLTGAAAGGRSA